MKLLLLSVITCMTVLVHSHGETTQQVTLSCPVSMETDRGPSGVPGKRGSKGEVGSTGPKGEKGEKGQTYEPRDDIESIQENILELERNLRSQLDDISLLMDRTAPLRRQSCDDLYRFGIDTNGVYKIFIDEKLTEVYCEFQRDGHNWLIFQKNFQRSLNYDVDWSNYKNGFGSLQGDFWLGLEKIYKLTSSGRCRLRLDVWDASDVHTYAEYSEFYIDDESNNYTLHVGGFTGLEWDRLNYHNNMPFTTKDRDNDPHQTANCAASNKGGWWHRTCFFVFFNTRSIYWREDAGRSGGGSVRKATMKMRC